MLPIVVIVIVIHLFFINIEFLLLVRFFIGAVLIVIGLSLFLIGVDKGIEPLGQHIGTFITKTNKLWVVLLTGIVLGFFISLAEPSLIVLSNEIERVSSGGINALVLLVVVSVGIAVLLGFAFYRILYSISLPTVLTVLYMIVFVMAFFTDPRFLTIAFDASGATTGVLAVPFILGLALGISHLKKDSLDNEADSFGVIAVVSVGAVASVMLFSIFTNHGTFSGEIEDRLTGGDRVMEPFISMSPTVLWESFLSFIPIVSAFLFFYLIVLRRRGPRFRKMLFGFVYALVGLIIFLLGVNGGFMEVGALLGSELAVNDSLPLILVISFALGIVTILAEPAVQVLSHQIEDVTSGYVTRGVVLIALSLGVGIAVALSALRVFIEPLQIWHYLLPGYAIALVMSHVLPKMFVGIAFDSGGVATGPMTATFILAFIQGAASAKDGADIILDGFGMIATVAMMPILTLSMLGLIYKLKSRKKGVDAQ